MGVRGFDGLMDPGRVFKVTVLYEVALVGCGFVAGFGRACIREVTSPRIFDICVYTYIYIHIDIRNRYNIDIEERLSKLLSVLAAKPLKSLQGPFVVSTRCHDLYQLPKKTPCRAEMKAASISDDIVHPKPWNYKAP